MQLVFAPNADKGLLVPKAQKHWTFQLCCPSGMQATVGLSQNPFWTMWWSATCQQRDGARFTCPSCTKQKRLERKIDEKKKGSRGAQVMHRLTDMVCVYCKRPFPKCIQKTKCPQRYSPNCRDVLAFTIDVARFRAIQDFAVNAKRKQSHEKAARKQTARSPDPSDVKDIVSKVRQAQYVVYPSQPGKKIEPLQMKSIRSALLFQQDVSRDEDHVSTVIFCRVTPFPIHLTATELEGATSEFTIHQYSLTNLERQSLQSGMNLTLYRICLLYTSDAADE